MNKYSFILIFIVGASILLPQCKKKKDENIIPDNLKVGVSDAISFPDLDKKKSLVLDEDTMTGRSVYQKLRTLIYLTDVASDMVQGAIDLLREQDITGPVAFSYTSTDDGNVKYVEVKQNVTYDSKQWSFGLTVGDELAGKALLVVWNPSPLKAVAVLHPMAYNAFNLFQRNAYIKVEYSEDDASYDRTMMVSVTGMDSLSLDYISKVKVFFGQQGDNVIMYGDYNMPDTYLMDPLAVRGRSWCFKAKNNTNLNIAVARVSLPHVTLGDITDLWSNYSLDKVMEDEMTSIFPTMDATLLQSYISGAVGNAYYVGIQGFVSNGDNIPDNAGFTSDFNDMSDFNPWPPAEIEAMTIAF